MAEIIEESAVTTRNFPSLANISTGFVFPIIPVPEHRKPPEYVYVCQEDTKRMKTGAAVSYWNLAWESAQLRYGMFQEDLPESLCWLENYADENIYLLPRGRVHRYYAHQPLYHLLPLRTLKHFRLPIISNGKWPYLIPNYTLDPEISRDFNTRLSNAFAHHIWPLIDSGSPLSGFSESDPIRLLAHNLDFWLPYAHRVLEGHLQEYPRGELDEDDQKRLEQAKQEKYPGIEFVPARTSGYLWTGEEEAWQVTQEVIEEADRNGKLRAIIEAVKANRAEDDFSDRWSFAKEDLERKLYSKRSKVKVRFVELTDTVPVHGPEAEIHEDLLWEDFLALLNEKERSITVLLKSGITRLKDIGVRLGYANHSPVSKALVKIREKALEYLF